MIITIGRSRPTDPPAPRQIAEASHLSQPRAMDGWSLVRWPPQDELRLLRACGAAGSISPTFNARIAGVFFALELILRDFEVRSFGGVVLASVIANVVTHAAFGSASFLPEPPFQIVSVWEHQLYALLGLAAAGRRRLHPDPVWHRGSARPPLGSRPDWVYSQRRVLRAAVRMKHEIAAHPGPAPERHLQGGDDQLGGQMAGHAPAHPPPAPGIDHHRQIQEP